MVTTKRSRNEHTVDARMEAASDADGLYAIGRLKAARNAWYWVVNFARRGETHYMRFYDLKHGGADKALAAAVAWRDRQLAATRALTYREFHAQRRSNNTSGVPGVHFLKNARQPEGIWQAKIKLPDGRKVTKMFSVHKFGAEQAFKHAVAARGELLALVDDRPYLYHPTAKQFAAKQ